MESKEITVQATGTTTELSTVVPIDSGELDIQIRTTKAYPRILSRCIEQATTYATYDADMAASCIYALPRGGKEIKGPSVRLAEVMLATYGNLRAGARIIERTDTHIKAQGVCHDTENNVFITKDVSRRITKKDGSRYDEDMIQIAENAACSIAVRNAVFAVIPRIFTNKILQECERVVAGDTKSLEKRRDDAVKFFRKQGITIEQILLKMERRKLEDLDSGDLVTLLGYANAIRDGECTAQDVFEVKVETVRKDEQLDKMKEKVKAKASQPKQQTSTRESILENIFQVIEMKGAKFSDVENLAQEKFGEQVDNLSEEELKKLLDLCNS